MLKPLALSVCILLFYSTGSSQSEVNIVIPSAEEEAAYIWNTIIDIDFFEQHNYQLSLPKGRLMDSLKVRSKDKRLSDDDFEALQDYVKDKVYNKTDYAIAAHKLNSQKKAIQQLLTKHHTIDRNWSFKNFDTYMVRMTLYGSGGSYNPDDGTIIIFTTPDGQFKQYENPANTIMHEIVHIGIEASIIGKYNIPHPLKERIVDLYVKKHFGKALPQYRIQPMGDSRIDAYLEDIEDFKSLDQVVERFLKDHE